MTISVNWWRRQLGDMALSASLSLRPVAALWELGAAMVCESGNSVSSFTLSRSAYAVALSHALKHESRATLGVLLGTFESDNECVRIARCVPAFHNYPTTPIIQICLEMVEAFAETLGLQIVGVYSANELLDDKSLSAFASVIAERIRQNTSICGIWAIDNETILEPGLENVCGEIFVKKGNCWVSASTSSKGGPLLEVTPAVSEFTSFKRQLVDYCRRVVDFEEHLSLSALDWRNNDLQTNT